MADCGQWDAVRDSAIQEREQMRKLRRENSDTLKEIRRIRQAIMANLKVGSLEPIDAELEARLQDRLEELKRIFL